MKKLRKMTAAVLTAALILATVPAQSLAAEADPADKLLAEYNFNDQTTNDSVGSHHATLYNIEDEAAGTYVEGKYGRALQLSVKGGMDRFWLSVPYEVFEGNEDSFTISICYQATGYNTIGEDSELFSFYNSTIENFLYYSYAAVKFQDMGYSMKWNGLTKSHGYANLPDTPYKKNEWVHLVYCVEAVDNQSVITAYADGKEIQVDQGGDWSNSLMSALGIDTFTIGGKNPYKGGDTPSCLFYGAVDDVRIYAGALTADEVAAIQPDDEIREPPATTAPPTTAPTTASAAPSSPTSGKAPADTHSEQDGSSFPVVWIVLACVVVAGGAAAGVIIWTKKRKKG